MLPHPNYNYYMPLAQLPHLLLQFTSASAAFNPRKLYSTQLLVGVEVRERVFAFRFLRFTCRNAKSGNVGVFNINLSCL